MFKLIRCVAARRVGAGILVLGAVFGGIASASAQATPTTSPAVTDVTVRYSDGRQQRFVRAEAAPPSTAPAELPPGPPAGSEPPPASNPTTIPSTQPANSTGRSLMGVNLEGLKDYSRSRVFIDTIRTSRRFGSPEKPWSGSEKIPLDENGWPTSDFGVVVFTEALDVNGVYRLSCLGRCTIKTVSSSPAKVRNVLYDERTDRTLAEVVVSADANKPASLFLSFTQTSGAVRNLKLLRPGYEGDFQVYTTEFLRSLQPFGSLRFMDWLATNSSTLRDWDERARPTDAQLTLEGGTYELAIDLGNRTKKDVWLHVPALASDAFIEDLAKLVKVKLDPNLYCYVEYSNEVWNGVFAQFKQNLDAAKAEVKAGEQTLNDGGSNTNTYYWGFRRVGKRSVEISRIFKRVFGNEMPRVRVVLCGQLVNTKVIEEPLEWIEKYAGGQVKDHIYGIAVAPYFGNKKDLMNSDGVTVDQITEVLLQKVIAGNNHHVTGHHALAKKYGVKSMAYEAGVDLGQFNKSVDAKIKAQFDPRAGEAVEKYLTNWFNSGGDVLMYYDLCCRYSRHGYWGLTDEIRNLAAPKYQAAARVAERMKAPTSTP